MLLLNCTGLTASAGEILLSSPGSAAVSEDGQGEWFTDGNADAYQQDDFLSDGSIPADEEPFLQTPTADVIELDVKDVILTSSGGFAPDQPEG